MKDAQRRRRDSLDPNYEKLIWLIRLRWIALGAQCLAAFPGVYFGFLDSVQLSPYFATILLLLGFQLGSLWLAQRRRLVRKWDLFSQLLADLLAVTVLLMLSGSGWNPLAPVLLVHAALGALCLEGWESALFFGVLLACVGTMELIPRIPSTLRFGPTPQPILFLCYLVVASVAWGLTRSLSKVLRELEIRVQRLKDQKERMEGLRAIGALAAGFSHELATPLNTIQARLERILRDTRSTAYPDALAARDALGLCEKALRQLNETRLDPDHWVLKKVEWESVLRDWIDSYSKEHPEFIIRVESELKLERCFCEVPLLSLGQAVFNFFDNIRSLPEVSSREAQVVLKAEDGYCVLEVKDRGPGFAKLILNQLGEPFVTSKPEGTGLGLHQAYSLARALGGDLTVRNRPQGGASVRLRLPMSPDAGSA